ncbi:MAG TPA: T9SS type A sorting domain-containing protein [Flavobacterium sp.]|nr:T9SS type A sorting domain-containing protein [Flavobacterium sp.]
MNKIYLLLLLITGTASAQVVNIPDANFKAKLIALDVDTNSDGEIQVSEAIVPYTLNLSNSSITDMTGIEAFVNLFFLNCSNNNISTLDLSSIVGLQSIDANNNPLTSINISNLANLTGANLQHCNLDALDVTGCAAVMSLSLQYNEFTVLDLSPVTALRDLNLDYTTVETVNLAGLMNLENFSATTTNLTTLDVSGSPSLQTLYLSSPALGAVNVSNCTALTELIIGGSTLTSLNVQGCSSLWFLQVVSTSGMTEFDASNLPNLSVLDVDNCTTLLTLNASGCPQLTALDASNCILTSIDVSGSTSLTELELQNNQLTTIDASACHALATIAVEGNPLETLLLKNGANEMIIGDMSTMSDLVFICTDQSQFEDLVTQFAGMPNVEINSYCSFTPGGDYNTIMGITSFDADNDGTCANDLPFPQIKLNITDGTNSGSTFTDADGAYSFFTAEGTFALTPQLEMPTYFSVTPASATVNFPLNNNSIATENFCLTPIGIHPDLEIVIAPLVPARPGFEAVYKIVYKNKGNQLVNSGAVTFYYNDNLMDFISAEPMTATQSTGTLTWSYANLMPFETRSIIVTMNINSPMDAMPVNNGDNLTFSAGTGAVEGDETPADNNFSFTQIAVGSYDPNDKLCMQGGTVSAEQIGEYLHYNINFENTGTFYAQNIVVRDVINEAQFDVSTLQVLEASHNVVTRISGNVAEFIFENIYLDTGGHGNILLKIKTLNTLSEGATVSNKADIFFDYNFPIETEDAVTAFVTLALGDNPQAHNLKVYPNPAGDEVYVSAASEIKSVHLYNLQGQILQSVEINDSTGRLNISKRQTGIYYIKVISAEGIFVQKLIKK